MKGRVFTPDLSHERVREVLDYNPSTGQFTWKVCIARNIKAGDAAGCVAKGNGYQYITIDGVEVTASRLALFFMKGEWPRTKVQFIDGDKTNCRYDNLTTSKTVYGNFDLQTKEGRTAYQRAYRAANPIDKEQNRLRTNQWNAQNRERSREISNRSKKKQREENPDKFAERNKNWRSKNVEKLRLYEINRKFNISSEEYKELQRKQNGVCAICECPETAVRRGIVLELAVDHCHDTGKVRGLLCSNCNTGIGKLKDSATLVRKAYEYLTTTTGASSPDAPVFDLGPPALRTDLADSAQTSGLNLVQEV